MLAFVSVYHSQKQKSGCFSDFNDFSEINNWKSIEKFGNVVNSPVELSHFPVIIKGVHCLRESHTMEIYSFTGLVYLVVTIQVQLCFCSYFIHLIYIVACVRLVGFGLFLFLCFPFKRIPFTYAAPKVIYEKYIMSERKNCCRALFIVRAPVHRLNECLCGKFTAAYRLAAHKIFTRKMLLNNSCMNCRRGWTELKRIKEN